MDIHLTDLMRQEYQQRFSTCEVRPERQSQVDNIVATIAQNKNRYQSVGGPLKIPWIFIGPVHYLESSLSFKRHLHNGDPLTARTVHVPSGRPPDGDPPFTWEQSATDAMTFERLDRVTDWSMPGILFQFEHYNGFGYRTTRPEVLSPYLWSFSNLYDKGKFVADGKFDPNARSNQCGSAVIVRRLAEQGFIQFDSNGDPVTDLNTSSLDDIESFEPLVAFSETEKSDLAATLQRALNTFPGIFLKVDGVPGQHTSDAFQKVTGHFLDGDSRA